MTPLLAIAFVLAAASSPPPSLPSPTSSSSPQPSPSPSTLPTPTTSPVSAPSSVHGRLLLITPAYLVFTTGDAVRLDTDTRVAPNLRLGQPIRVRFDPVSHHVRSVEVAKGANPPNEADASALPRSYVAVSPASARSGENAKTVRQTTIINITFVVHVPDDTPIGDDIYLSTERSNFSPAELKMNRTDVRRWSISLPLVEGTTLHYQYTRGNYATVERDDGGGVIAPHTVEVHEHVHTDDTVARWADTS